MSDAEVCNDLCSNSCSTFPKRLREPQRPSKPVAECDDGIYVTVKWTQPEDVGGADITKYVIKFGHKDTDVNDYTTLSVPGNTTSFQFTDQLEDKELMRYQFAVAAVNRAGQGEFSEFSDDVETWVGK